MAQHRGLRPDVQPYRFGRGNGSELRTKRRAVPRGCSSEAEHQLPKLRTRVRFPSPALTNGCVPGTFALGLCRRDKFIGDAALCVFGVPSRTTDDASQALDAGKLIIQRRAALPRAVDCGIGISTGVVTAGNLGNDTRYECTVRGDTVNEAARLSDLAKSLPSGIAASAEVVETR
jgi:class 3 adenylate cyclase